MTFPLRSVWTRPKSRHLVLDRDALEDNIKTMGDLSTGYGVRHREIVAIEIAELIGEAGLATDHWVGDYEGQAFSTPSSEIIPLGSHKA